MRIALLQQEASRLLEEGIAARVFSGAQAAVWLAEKRAFALARAGTTSSSVGAPSVGDDTLFDVASLTKLFTATVALRAAARGELQLDSTIGLLVRELEGTPQHGATLEAVLAHEAGFTPWAPLFESVPRPLIGTPEAKTPMLEALALRAPASQPDGIARYSDLGFIALGIWLERAFFANLADLVRREVTEPSDLSQTRFCAGPPAVSTGVCRWSGVRLEGIVHDDNARALGGIAGHAGLFSTARDIAALGAKWLDSLEGGGDLLPRELAIRAVRRRASGRGLGFDLKSAEGSSAGSRISGEAFGHLGFTGCSIWVDPERRAALALLTNRVHTSADLDAIKAFRPRFHDAMIEALDRA